MINRRDFILSSFGALLTSNHALAAFDGLVKRPQEGYYPNLLARLYGWYNEEFYNFAKQFSKAELEYLVTAFKKARYLRWETEDGTSYKKIYWSTRLIKDKTSYSRLTVGFEPNEDDVRKNAMTVIIKNRVNDFAELSKKDICGLGWDFDNHTFKVYFYTDKNKLTKYLSSLKTPPPFENIPDKAVASLKFQNGQLKEKRLCIPVQKFLSQRQKEKILNFERAPQVMGHYSNVRDVAYFPDYIGINFMRLPTSLKEYCEKIMDNFATGPTTGIINFADNMTLYYP